MSSKLKITYLCSECGFETPRWYGKCPGCGEWNTLSESVRQPERAVPARTARLPVHVTEISSAGATAEIRRDCGLRELNRVLGGGAVDGSVILLSGDPGIGKSTLLLQICKTLCRERKVLYVAGEESPRQIKMRAERLGLGGENLFIAEDTDVDGVIQAAEQMRPDAMMIDSIQTMSCSGVASSPGSVTQVRESAALLIRAAKTMDMPVFLVGHVNKDGGIAGPRVLEHMVDVVLYFEGERHSSYRILRAVKNRFGSTNEIGVLEMGQEGLTDVENPSQMLLSGRPSGVSGTCVACVMEGSRPVLAEIQALVGKTAFAAPRRMATGFDYNRMAILIAVLEKRAGYFFGNLDAWINVVGGLRLDEPAADLPVAMALASNLLDKCVPDDVAMFGEIGLAGELRSVGHARQRIAECARLGFETVLLPHSCVRDMDPPSGVRLLPVKNIAGALEILR